MQSCGCRTIYHHSRRHLVANSPREWSFGAGLQKEHLCIVLMAFSDILPHKKGFGYNFSVSSIFPGCASSGSGEMDGDVFGRSNSITPCDIERTIALLMNALRAYERKSSELIPPGHRSRGGTFWLD